MGGAKFSNLLINRDLLKLAEDGSVSRSLVQAKELELLSLPAAHLAWLNFILIESNKEGNKNEHITLSSWWRKAQ